jgi:hypothetical protein
MALTGMGRRAGLTLVDDVPAAESEAQFLELLGGLSIDMFARQRAAELADITTPEVLYDPFVAIPGGAGSIWDPAFNALGAITRPSGVVGGVARFDSGTDANGSAQAAAGAVASTLVGGIFANPQTSRLYTLFHFRLRTTPDAEMAFRMGVITGGASTMNAGVRGASSTTRFRFSSGTSGALSTVAVDTGWHLAEMWTTADGVCHGAIDDETPVSYTLPSLAVCFPWLIIANGTTAASQSADIDTAVYIFPKAA